MSVLIKFDQGGYDIKKADLNIVAGYLQQAVTAYNALHLPALTNAEFVQLFYSPIDLVFDKMTDGQPVSIGGLTIDKSKAIEIIVKPQGYDTMLSTISTVIEILKNEHQFHPSTIQHAFELDESGDVVIITSYDQNLQEQFKRYAISDNAIGLNQLATDIISRINTLGLMNTAQYSPGGFADFIANLFESSYGKTPTIKVATILRFNS